MTYVYYFYCYRFFFFFNDTATTEIYTLSLHDALPIFSPGAQTRLDDDSARDPLTKRGEKTGERLGRTLRTRGDEQVVAAAQTRSDLARRAHTLLRQDVPVSIGVPPQLDVSRHFSRRVSKTRFTQLVKQGTVW